ncbi:NGFI-A-binding protein 1 isoform X9 [Cherax quadricarinatus]
MLLVPPTSRSAHAAEPVVPPTSDNRCHTYPNTLVPIKGEPGHLHPHLPHMSGLNDTQYPPASTATHSAPNTPAPPSTPTPAPPVSAPSDRSASGGSASGGPLSIIPPSVVGPSGPILPASTSTGSVGGGSVGALTPAMPVPGPSNPQQQQQQQGQQQQQQQQQQPPLHHPLLGYVSHGNKILSRNLNGTRNTYPTISQSDRRVEPIRRVQEYGLPMAVTSQPSNESELQLYRVLQRANLLNYYDTFISQGGDDVQQLCEAGEEEFLEIMALVGMASKPLHVRRLQKALQEWVSNPAMFQIPLLPNLPPSVVAGFPSLGNRALLGTPTPTPTRPSPPITTPTIHANHNSSPGINKETLVAMNNNSMGVRDSGCVSSTMSVAATTSSSSTPISTPGGCPTNARDGPMGLGASGMGGPMPLMGGAPMSGLSGGIGGSRGPSPHHTSPTHPGLPPTSVGLQNCHGTMTPDKNAEFFLPLMKYIMNMSEDDPRRMEEIRKYAAIYGRFDCKRKPEKPLTLHEVSVNEAAAQICKYMPALLTRRDELFPLARQVVRDSGYQYSKGHSRSQTIVGREEEPRTKRTRSDSGHDAGDLKNDLQWKKRQERLEAISEELRHMSERAEEVRTSLSSGGGDISALTSQMDALQSRHSQLTLEQNELLKAQRKAKSDRVSVCSEERERGEDSDSQFSYSGASSPSQVLSSSQGNIIAVTNPALAMSAAMVPSQLSDEERHISALYTLSQTVGAAAAARGNSIKQEPNSPGATKQE